MFESFEPNLKSVMYFRLIKKSKCICMLPTYKKYRVGLIRSKPFLSFKYEVSDYSLRLSKRLEDIKKARKTKQKQKCTHVFKSKINNEGCCSN